MTAAACNYSKGKKKSSKSSIITVSSRIIKTNNLGLRINVGKVFFILDIETI